MELSAISWSRSNMLLALGLAMVVLMSGMRTSDAILTAAECRNMRYIGLSACKQLLLGLSPTAECCYRIRITPEYCVCPSVTPARAALVKDIPKAIRIIESCGRHVPRHHKCGSITSP